jgi:hypothetical protein
MAHAPSAASVGDADGDAERRRRRRPMGVRRHSGIESAFVTEALVCRLKKTV